MAKKTALQTWSEYLAARAGMAAIGSFNVDANLRTGQVLGRLLNKVDHRHRRRGEANIARSFPEWSKEKVQRCCEASVEHLAQLAIEAIQMPREINVQTWPDRVRLHELGPALEVLNRPGPAIVLTGHLGNFEVLGYTMSLLGYDIDAVARPLDNQKLNDWLYGIREAKGMRIITKFNATDRMLAVLRRGGYLGFTADQNAGEKGMFVPFFNKLASTYKSIGLLALRYRCPVVCGYAQRVGPGFRYEIGTTDIIEPEEWAGHRDPLFYISARYAHAFEKMVYRRPEQYFWMHRRWKSRPRHELQGKAMPKAMRRNLETLPWMNDEKIALLERNAGPGEP